MAFTTVVSVRELSGSLRNPNWVVVDCRFSLKDTERGRRAYLESHIPGAVYAHLDEDLSGSIAPGKTGRHPLPELPDVVSTFSSWGITSDTQVIVYDDLSGAIAARLWWMLRWMGHDQAALLDGGIQAWERSGLPVEKGARTRTPKTFEAHPRPELLATTEELEAELGSFPFWLLDARERPRFLGEVEPIDPVAGHVPGAISFPYTENLDSEGFLLDQVTLRNRFQKLIGKTSKRPAVCYCGSGVTAALNLVGMLHSGLGDGRLYAGSWSEWIASRDRPIETGPESPLSGTAG